MAEHGAAGDVAQSAADSGNERQPSANVAGGLGDHTGSMEAHVTVLEHIANMTMQALTEIKTDIRSLREDLTAESRLLREDFKTDIRSLREDFKAESRSLREDGKADIRSLREDMGSLREDMWSLRDKQELDFRLMFAALITTTVALAGLMAKGFHWF